MIGRTSFYLDFVQNWEFKMTENSAEQEVRDLLESIGQKVERIPAVQQEQRADFITSDSGSRYIVEVKGREHDTVYEEALRRSVVAHREDFLGRSNSVSRQIRDGANQLLATPNSGNPFRVLALVAAERQADAQLVQFESTLYGKVDLITPGPAGSAVATPCYYFTFSEFFNHRYVEAALILIPNGAVLFVNDFATRADEFRGTELYRFFEKHEALADPPQLEAAGAAYIADCNVDRHDEKALLAYIKEKYRLEHLQTFTPTLYTTGTLIQHNEES